MFHSKVHDNQKKKERKKERERERERVENEIRLKDWDLSLWFAGNWIMMMKITAIDT